MCHFFITINSNFNVNFDSFINIIKDKCSKIPMPTLDFNSFFEIECAEDGKLIICKSGKEIQLSKDDFDNALQLIKSRRITHNFHEEALSKMKESDADKVLFLLSIFRELHFRYSVNVSEHCEWEEYKPIDWHKFSKENSSHFSLNAFFDYVEKESDKFYKTSGYKLVVSRKDSTIYVKRNNRLLTVKLSDARSEDFRFTCNFISLGTIAAIVATVAISTLVGEFVKDCYKKWIHPLFENDMKNEK